MATIDRLVSWAAVVLGRTDKWEMDTLRCVCANAELDRPVTFSRTLRNMAKSYLESQSPWIRRTTWKSIETPNWIKQRVKNWPGAHGSLPGYATYKFRSGNREYRCFCEYTAGWSEEGGDLLYVKCDFRTILAGCESMAVSSSSGVVSMCRCPHWTPPESIAALLASPRLVGSTSAAVVILNDEICTHAALACQ